MFIARRLLGVGNFYCVGAVCQGFIFDLAAPLLEKLPQGGDLIAIGVLSPFIVPMIICFFTAF